jgi:DNA-binding transcriptional ArsR family regulator
MIRVLFTPEDLAEVRFAFSPTWELVMSAMKALKNPAKHALHLPWVQEARTAIDGRDLEILFALTSGSQYVPDFVTPPPTTPFPELDEELEVVASTPAARVRIEIDKLVDGIDGRAPEPVRLMAEDPAAWLPRLVDQMREFWKLTIEEHWPRIRAMHEGDVMYRARQLALGGAELLFGDLHPSVAWRDGVLEIDKPHEADVMPAGSGMILIPAVFDWPGVAVIHDEAYRFTLSYSPRGIANIWEAEPQRSGAMDDLIGATRADILRILEVPMTTSEIATRLHLTPAAVSQQLGLLRRAGVVDAHRQGRGVYSTLTPHGKTLLELLGS